MLLRNILNISIVEPLNQDIRFGNVAFKGITMTGSQIQGPGNSDLLLHQFLERLRTITREFLEMKRMTTLMELILRIFSLLIL